MLVTMFLLWQVFYRYTRRETDGNRRTRSAYRDGLSSNERLGDVLGEVTGDVLGDVANSGLELEPVEARPGGNDFRSELLLQPWEGRGDEFVRRRSFDSSNGRGDEIVRRRSFDSSNGSETSEFSGNQQLVPRDQNRIVLFGAGESRTSSVVDAVVAPPTFVNRMRYKAGSIIKNNASHVFKTSAITKIINYLEAHMGPTLYVITGRQGDGKTAAGFKVLSELEDRGVDVYHVTEPKQLSKLCLKAFRTKIAVLVENIFGEVIYDEHKWRDWQQVITGVLKHENGPVILVTGNNFVIQPWLNRLESTIDVLEIQDITQTCELSFEDKLGVLRALETKHGLDIPEALREIICKLEVRYGFPKRCCQYLNDVYKKYPMNRNFSSFTATSNYEMHMVKQLMRRPDIRDLFTRMLACSGKMDITHITDGNARSQLNIIAKDYDGIFLCTKGNLYVFTSESMYSLVAFAYWDIDKLFILENCPMEFLNSKLRFKGTGDYLNISEEDMGSLVSRCLREINGGNLLLVLSLDLIRSPVFAQALMRRVLQIWAPLERVLCLEDRTHHTTLAFLLSSSKSSEILKIVLKDPQFLEVIAIRFTVFTDIVFGICDAAAIDCLDLLLSGRFMVDLDIRNDLNQTPAMVAANNKQEVFLMKLLSMDLNFDACDVNMSTLLHYVCESGLLKPLNVLLEVCDDVNIRDKDGRTPLHCACEFKHTGVVFRLLQKDAIIETVSIHEACKTGDVELVELLTDNGGDIHALLENGDSVLHTACGNTFSLKMIKYLIEKGIDVNARGYKDRTPLIIAQAANNSVIVNYLKQIGDSELATADPSGAVPSGADPSGADPSGALVGDEQHRLEGGATSLGGSWPF